MCYVFIWGKLQLSLYQIINLSVFLSLLSIPQPFQSTKPAMGCIRNMGAYFHLSKNVLVGNIAAQLHTVPPGSNENWNEKTFLHFKCNLNNG